MNDLLEAILLHLIESTIWCLLFIFLAQRLTKRNSVMRSWIYRIAILKLIFPTVWLASLIQIQPNETLAPFIVTFSEPIEIVTHTAPAISAATYLSIVWLFGIFILALRSLLTVFRFSSLLRSELQPFSNREKSLLSLALNQMGEPLYSVQGHLSNNGPVIGLYGIFRPRIIAKHEFLEVLNDNELIAALKHEIAHKIRLDNVWHLITDAITTLMWFNPIAWILRNELLIATEKACDECVLQSEKASGDYANCLLKAAEYSHVKGYFCSVALSETSLKTRVSNVIHYQKGNHTIMKSLAILASAVMLISGSVTLLAASEAPQKEKIYGINEVDSKPKPTKQVPPKYPEELKKNKVNGKVIVEFVVGVDGTVSNAKAIHPLPKHTAFVAPAIESILQWQFSPGLIEGEPVKVRVKAPLVFKATPDIPGWEKVVKSTNASDVKFVKQMKDKMSELKKMDDPEKRKKEWLALKDEIAERAQKMRE